MFFLTEEEDKPRSRKMELNYNHYMKEMLIKPILSKRNLKN